MHSLRFSLIAAVLVAAAAAVTCPVDARPRSATASDAFVAGHLFVSSADSGNTQGGAVYRYKITNGVPSSRPDHTYFLGPSGGGALPAFSVNAAGVASFTTCCFSVQTYGQQGQFSFSWSLVEPYDDMAFPGIAQYGTRMLVDYVTLPSALRRRGSDAASCDGADAPLSGVQVYGPYNDKTFERPLLWCFAVDEGSPEFVGLAAARNELFVPNQTKVEVFGPVTGHAALKRTLSGPSFNAVQAAAVDDDGRLYTLNRQPYSYVAVYDAQASGQVKALREIAYTTQQQWNGNIAVDSRYVFIGADQSVLVYPKGTSGRRAPLAILHVASQGTSEGPWIAIGP